MEQPRNDQKATPAVDPQIPQVRLPQATGNSNQYSSQSSGAHNAMPQVNVDANGRFRRVHQNIPSYVSLQRFNFRNSPFSRRSRFKFNKLPFFDIKTIIHASILIGFEECTLENASRGMMESSYKLQFSPELINLILLNQNVVTKEYIYQLQIRICEMKDDSNEVIDSMPPGIQIRVNNQHCQLPPFLPGLFFSNKRMALPINCTELLNLNPNFYNKIDVNWLLNSSDPSYVIGIFLVKALDTLTVLKRLEDKGANSSETTKVEIIKYFKRQDSDLVTSSYSISLLCPLTKKRIEIPAKSVNCQHLQCFDAKTFLSLNEKRGIWKCPVCDKHIFYEDIQIQSYFVDVLTSDNLPESCIEIDLLPDGEWKIHEKSTERDVSGPEEEIIQII